MELTSRPVSRSMCKRCYRTVIQLLFAWNKIVLGIWHVRKLNQCKQKINRLFFRMLCLSRDIQQLDRIFRRCGILSVVNCLCLIFKYKSKTALSQQRVAGNLKLRYTFHAQLCGTDIEHWRRDIKSTSGMHCLEVLPSISS